MTKKDYCEICTIVDETVVLSTGVIDIGRALLAASDGLTQIVDATAEISAAHETWINRSEETDMDLAHLIDEVKAVLLDPKLSVTSRRRLTEALRDVCYQPPSVSPDVLAAEVELSRILDLDNKPSRNKAAVALHDKLDRLSHDPNTNEADKAVLGVVINRLLAEIFGWEKK